MKMTIDEAVLELRWLKKVNRGILETDAKELDVDSTWIKHWESVTQALDITIDTARKYQMMQAEYETRLKADIEAILVELQMEIEELPSNHSLIDGLYEGGYKFGLKEVNELVQERIDALRGKENEG